jgi:hypothetical protein
LRPDISTAHSSSSPSSASYNHAVRTRSLTN